MNAPEPPRRVVLVGFMAAGKTAVGAELARRLGWRHLDLDRVIEEERGESVSALFARLGEAGFRELETEATRALAGEGELVLSPGGGWLARPGNLELLGPGTLSVWLRVSAEEALRRAAAAPGSRPLLAGPQPLAAARALLAAREPLYARAALHLDTHGTTAAALADRVANEVRTRGARTN